MSKQRIASRPKSTLVRCAVFVALVCCAGGCRTVRASPIPEALKTEAFCVQKHANDVRNFDERIAKTLTEKGFQMSRAAKGLCPSDTPYLVSYFDHFGWDLRVFLAKMTIEVTDAETTEILGYGESRQGSLGALGTNYQDVIDRALAAMLGEGEEAE